MNSREELRKKAFQFRKNITITRLDILSLQIQKNIINSIFYQTCDKLCLYASVRGEAMTDYLAAKAYQDGKNVFYPRCNPDEKGIMQYRLCKSDADLQKGLYDIPEPSNDCEAIENTELNTTETLIIVPALLYSFQGFRLGYGQGYYDRFLKQVPLAISIGPCFSEQLEAELPNMPWDLPVKYLATEYEVFPSRK